MGVKMDDKRVYFVTKFEFNQFDEPTYNHVLGIFTNQKRVLEGISKTCELDTLYIIGSRKNKKLTSVSLNVELQSPKRVDIYSDVNDKIAIQINQIHLNNVNPKLLCEK